MWPAAFSLVDFNHLNKLQAVAVQLAEDKLNSSCSLSQGVSLMRLSLMLSGCRGGKIRIDFLCFFALKLSLFQVNFNSIRIWNSPTDLVRAEEGHVMKKAIQLAIYEDNVKILTLRYGPSFAYQHKANSSEIQF